MSVKDKVVEALKNNSFVVSIVGVSVVSLTLILIAIFALQEFVVSVCVLIVIEAAMAALLHQAELWKHGVLLGIQIVAGAIIGRVPLTIICAIAYVAATLALHFMAKKEDVSPKA